MVVLLFYALARPCKQENANVVQSILYAMTAFVLYTVSSARFHKHRFPHYLLVLLCLLMPHVVLYIYMIYKIIRRTGLNLSFLQRVFYKHSSVQSSSVFHYQSYPNEHSQLLNAAEEPIVA